MSDFPASANLISFLYLLFAFFKHLNNKQPVSTISVKTQSIFLDQLSIMHFIFTTVYSLVSFKKSWLQGVHCLWGSIRVERMGQKVAWPWFIGIFWVFFFLPCAVHQHNFFMYQCTSATSSL